MLKYLLATISVSIVAALGLLVNKQSEESGAPKRVARSSVPVRVFAAGRIEGASEEIELRSQISGRIVEVKIEEGQKIVKGQPLLRVDDEQYQQEVALAKAQLDLAQASLDRLQNGARKQECDEARFLLVASQANLERANLNWNRIKQLHIDGAVSQQDRDNHRTQVAELAAQVSASKSRLEFLTAPARPDEVAMAKAKIGAAKAQLHLAEHTLQKATIRSPVNGTVLQVNSRPGELATPDSQSPTLLIADTSAYRVRAFVEEIDAPRIQLGMSVEVTADGLPGRALAGQISRLSPRMSSKQIWSDDPAENYDTKTREIWITLEPGQGELVLGLRVDVTIETEVTPPSAEVAKK